MYRVLKIEKLANKFFSLTGASKLLKKIADDRGGLHNWQEVYDTFQRIIPFLQDEEKEDPEGAANAQKEARLIAEAYKEAIKIDRGYKYVYNMLETLYDNYADFIPDEIDEGIISEMTNDIMARAEHQDPNWMDKPMKTVNQMGVTEWAPDVEAIRHFVSQEREKLESGETTQETIWDTGGGAIEAPSSPYEQVDYTDPSRAANKSIFDTGNEDKYSPLTEGHGYVNYKTKYNNIINTQTKLLKQETDPKKQALRQELIGEYQKLINLYTELDKNFKEWQPTFGVSKDIAEKKLKKTKEKIAEVKEQIRIKKYSLKRMKQKDYLYELKSKLPNIKNPEERFIAEQEIAIAEANASGDKHVGKSNSIRRKMIKRVKGITYDDKKTGQKILIDKADLNNPHEMAKFQKELAEAQKLIVPYEEAKKEDLAKKELELGRMTKEREVDLGWTPEDAKKLEEAKLSKYHKKLTDIDTMELPNITKKLSEALSSTKMGEQKRITKEFKNHPAVVQHIKLHIKNLNDTLKKQDRAAYSVALKEMNDEIRNDMDTYGRALPAFIEYEAHLQDQKNFVTILSMVKILTKKLFQPVGKGKDRAYTWKTDTLDESDISLIDNIIEKCKPLIERHQRIEGKETMHTPAPGSIAENILRGPNKTGPKEFYSHLGSPAEILKILVNYLNNLKATKTVTANAKIRSRIKLLSKLAQPVMEEEIIKEPVTEEPVIEPIETTPVPEEDEENIDLLSNIVDTLITRNVNELMSSVVA